MSVSEHNGSHGQQGRWYGKGKRFLLFRTIDGVSETLMAMRGHTKLKLLYHEICKLVLIWKCIKVLGALR